MKTLTLALLIAASSSAHAFHPGPPDERTKANLARLRYECNLWSGKPHADQAKAMAKKGFKSPCILYTAAFKQAYWPRKRVTTTLLPVSNTPEVYLGEKPAILAPDSSAPDTLSTFPQNHGPSPADSSSMISRDSQ